MQHNSTEMYTIITTIITTMLAYLRQQYASKLTMSPSIGPITCICGRHVTTDCYEYA